MRSWLTRSTLTLAGAALALMPMAGVAAAAGCTDLGGVDNPGECTISTAVTGKSGTFDIPKNLHITGTGSISVALPPPFPRTITINIDGSLIMDTGAKIIGDVPFNFSGKAATITINATADINLAPRTTVPPAASNGAQIRSIANSGNCPGSVGGDITLNADSDHDGTGDFTSDNGSQVISSGACLGGAVVVTGAKIDIDGEVSSIGRAAGQGRGGPVTVDAECTATVSNTGIVQSIGTDPGADLVHIEGGCAVSILGLVQSTGAGHVGAAPHCTPPFRPGKPALSNACVEIWSGGPLTIDSKAPNHGQVSADLSGANPAGWNWIELFAVADITINGAPAAPTAFSVHANENLKTNAHGGFIRVTSTAGSVIASGRDFQTNAIAAGSIGGKPGPFPLAGCATAPCGGIVIEGDVDVDLRNGLAESRGAASGGQIDVRAFNGLIAANASTKLDVNLGPNGIVNLNSCTGPVGNNFPPGSVVPLGAVVINATNMCGGAPLLPVYVAPYVNGQPQPPIVPPALPTCPGFCGGGCPCISSASLSGTTLTIKGVDLDKPTVKQVFLNPASCDPAGQLFSQPFVSQSATSIQLNLTGHACPAPGCNVIVVGPSSSCCLATKIIFP